MVQEHPSLPYLEEAEAYLVLVVEGEYQDHPVRVGAVVVLPCQGEVAEVEVLACQEEVEEVEVLAYQEEAEVVGVPASQVKEVGEEGEVCQHGLVQAQFEAERA